LLNIVFGFLSCLIVLFFWVLLWYISLFWLGFLIGYCSYAQQALCRCTCCRNAKEISCQIRPPPHPWSIISPSISPTAPHWTPPSCSDWLPDLLHDPLSPWLFDRKSSVLQARIKIFSQILQCCASALVTTNWRTPINRKMQQRSTQKIRTNNKRESKHNI